MKWEVSLTGHSSKKVAHAKIRVSQKKKWGAQQQLQRRYGSNFGSNSITREEEEASPPSSSSTFWRTRATWDGQLKESGQHTTATFSRKVQGEQQEYWFPFSLWHKYWSRLHYWKTANPMICFCTIRVPLPNIVISNWSLLVPKLTTLKLTYRSTKSLMYSTNSGGMQPVFLCWFYSPLCLKRQVCFIAR